MRVADAAERPDAGGGTPRTGRGSSSESVEGEGEGRGEVSPRIREREGVGSPAVAGVAADSDGEPSAGAGIGAALRPVTPVSRPNANATPSAAMSATKRRSACRPVKESW